MIQPKTSNKPLQDIVESLRKTRTHTRYYLKDGTWVPGVTTITKLRDKPALVYVAWQLGTEGKNYREEWKKQANIGSIGHGMIKLHLYGVVRELNNSQVEEATKEFLSEYAKAEIDKAENAFLGYLEWEQAYKVKPILIEVPLISEKHRYGGTIDLYAELNGKSRDLVDFKTAKGIFPEMRVQVLGGYRALLIENKYPVDRTHILQIGKEDGTFHHEQQGDPTVYRRWFLNMRKVYEDDRVIFKK